MAEQVVHLLRNKLLPILFIMQRNQIRQIPLHNDITNLEGLVVRKFAFIVSVEKNLDEANKFFEVSKLLKLLMQQFAVPRCFKLENFGCLVRRELHYFCDASNKG